MDEARVLVTGGTDVVSATVVAALIEARHRVRVSLRSVARAPDVQEMVAAAFSEPDRIGFVEDADPAVALAGRDVVVHVTTNAEDTDETDRIIRDARAAGIARIIVLGRGAGPPDVLRLRHPAVLGPALVPEHLAAATGPVRRLLGGRPPFLLPGWHELVDIRDLADLVVALIASDREAGEVVVPGIWLRERSIGRILDAELGNRAERVPWCPLPGWALRAAGLVHPGARAACARLVDQDVLTARRSAARDARDALAALGWEPREAEETVIDAAESVLEFEPPPSPFGALSGMPPLR